MPNTSDGQRGEDFAAEYLARRGYRILARNYRTRYGEIDIVAQCGEVLALVEVKTRRPASWGGAAGAVTPKKQHRLILAAEQYLQENPTDAMPRFDVVALTTSGGEEFRVISCEHLKGAFELNAENGFF